MTDLHPLLVISHGEVDFDCPHVDTPEGQDLISSWSVSFQDDHICTLRGLYRMDGRPARPIPGVPTSLRLDQMQERSEMSNNPSTMFFHAYFPAVQAHTGKISVHPAGTRLHISRDLAILDLRDTTDPEAEVALPIRGRADSVRIAPISGPHAPDASILPIWDRSGAHAAHSAHRSLERLGGLEAQIRGLLEIARHPRERVIEPFLFS